MKWILDGSNILMFFFFFFFVVLDLSAPVIVFQIPHP